MANSLNISVNLTGTINGSSFPAASSVSSTPASSSAFKETIVSSATAAALSTGAVTNVGYMVIQNVDAANTLSVTLTSSTTGAQVIQPGGCLVLSPGAVAVYACSNSTSTQVTVTAIST